MQPLHPKYVATFCHFLRLPHIHWCTGTIVWNARRETLTLMRMSKIHNYLSANFGISSTVFYRVPVLYFWTEWWTEAKCQLKIWNYMLKNTCVYFFREFDIIDSIVKITDALRVMALPVSLSGTLMNKFSNFFNLWLFIYRLYIVELSLSLNFECCTWFFMDIWCIYICSVEAV